MKNWIKGICALALIFSYPSFAIRGGTPAGDDEFMGVGYLEPACTATLISPDSIITANHCLEQMNYNLSFLKFHYRANGQDAEMQAIDYRVLSSDHPSELALIRLKGAVAAKDVVSIGKDVSGVADIVGFGATENLPLSTAALVGQVQFKLSDDAGDPMFRTTPANAHSNIACSGDSGGPLLVHGALVGVLSFGYSKAANFGMLSGSDQCVATTAAYYVPVRTNLAWILKALAEMGAKGLKN